jgi:hypothetical protein
MTMVADATIGMIGTMIGTTIAAMTTAGMTTTVANAATRTIGVGMTMTEDPTVRLSPSESSTAEATQVKPTLTRRRRRRRAAPVGRILAAGLSTSATFGLVAAMAWPDRTADPAQTAAGAPLPIAVTPQVPEGSVPPVVVYRPIPIPEGGSGAALPGVDSSRGRVAPTPTIATPRRSKPVTTSRGS